MTPRPTLNPKPDNPMTLISLSPSIPKLSFCFVAVAAVVVVVVVGSVWGSV